ncbi:hypothetical protein Nepgr_006957 [Nepenthes gracilis]|uniref:EF-hand domain-containing protein n=1 Tax=Nepenthes gracilis TaxID=150966 RepID=A0AAD3S6S5_NEPGR|nr:hypothetical protein Nepgr_006957 [Nepenthes gracilis]
MGQSTMELVDVFSLKKFIYLASLQKLISNCWLFARSRFTQFGNLQIITEKNNNYEFESQTANFKEGEDNEILELRRNDIAMIMQRLGIPWNLEEEEDLSKEEICGIFDEKEAILEEMKEAFNVFDENRDGFIDAEELQRVLCILGFREGLELQACSLMIRSFDENGDGKIDFDEFLRIAENWV